MCEAQAKKWKKMKLGANSELEKILLKWFQQMRSDNVPINDPSFKRRQMKLHFASI
jgi:hypothetical protein